MAVRKIHNLEKKKRCSPNSAVEKHEECLHIKCQTDRQRCDSLIDDKSKIRRASADSESLISVWGSARHQATRHYVRSYVGSWSWEFDAGPYYCSYTNRKYVTERELD